MAMSSTPAGTDDKCDHVSGCAPTSSWRDKLLVTTSLSHNSYAVLAMDYELSIADVANTKKTNII